MMAKNSRRSQGRHLLSTSRQRKTYFYVRNGISLMAGIGFFHWSKEMLGGAFAMALGIFAAFIFYKFIAHYIAIVIVGIEEFLGG